MLSATIIRVGEVLMFYIGSYKSVKELISRLLETKCYNPLLISQFIDCKDFI